MSDTLSRRDFLKIATIASASLALSRVVRVELPQASTERQDLENKAEIVKAETDLPARVMQEFGLRDITSSFAVECHGTVLSQFVLGSSSINPRYLAIYTDLNNGGGIKELTYHESGGRAEWIMSGVKPTDDPQVISYPTEKERGNNFSIAYFPPSGQAEKIGFDSKNNESFWFSPTDLPENAQKALLFV